MNKLTPSSLIPTVRLKIIIVPDHERLTTPFQIIPFYEIENALQLFHITE